jgi:type II secretory pathway pseudopilin PulG
MRQLVFVHVVFLVLLLSTMSVAAQECLRAEGPSPDQAERREAAVRYLATVNAAQARAQQQNGTFVPLSEAVAVGAPPVGFVPTLPFDRWSYIVRLSDLFDPCGFTLFANATGKIYEAHPRPAITAPPPPTGAGNER